MVDRLIDRLLEYAPMPRACVRLGAAICAASLLTACAGKTAAKAEPSRPQSQVAKAAPATQTETPTPVAAQGQRPQAGQPAPVAPDPVANLIAESNRHFEAAQRELKAGRQAEARTEFDRAVAVAVESPHGAKTEARVREHLDRLLERIRLAESAALAQAETFKEQKVEAAPLDEILTIPSGDKPAPTPATTEAVAEDLSETTYDIDIPLNAKVLSYVELFRGRLKGYLQDGLNRGDPYLPMIQDVFRSEGVPEDLAYVPLIESAFKTTAVSRAKAKGMWQFMRGTALENGLKHDWYIDERSDPEKATRAAAKYLKTLYGMFGDWHLALASYNGGPGRVQRAMKRSGRQDFWEISASTRYLPRETREYVPLILAAVIVARNPDEYGMTLAAMPAPAVERVSLSTPVDLRMLAEWVGVPLQTIQDLNPELRRWTTPIRMSPYEIKVPEGSAEVIRTKLEETDPLELSPLARHTVKKGETLLSISRKLKVTRTDLAEANYLSPKAQLRAGQSLIIPRAPSLLLAGSKAPESVAASAASGGSGSALPDVVPATDTGRTIKTSAARTPAAAAKPAASNSSTKVVHRVKAGETLTSIAKTYGTTVAAVKETNRLRTNTIQTGQRLSVVTRRTLATD
jgi:membrane-bound lytic murein transglycosylase D